MRLSLGTRGLGSAGSLRRGAPRPGDPRSTRTRAAGGHGPRPARPAPGDSGRGMTDQNRHKTKPAELRFPGPTSVRTPTKTTRTAPNTSTTWRRPNPTRLLGPRPRRGTIRTRDLAANPPTARSVRQRGLRAGSKLRPKLTPGPRLRPFRGWPSWRRSLAFPSASCGGRWWPSPGIREQARTRSRAVARPDGRRPVQRRVVRPAPSSSGAATTNGRVFCPSAPRSTGVGDRVRRLAG
jgi:hypothetical protein